MLENALILWDFLRSIVDERVLYRPTLKYASPTLTVNPSTLIQTLINI